MGFTAWVPSWVWSVRLYIFSLYLDKLEWGRNLGAFYRQQSKYRIFFWRLSELPVKHSCGVFPKYNGLVKQSCVFPKYKGLAKHSCGVFPKGLVKHSCVFPKCKALVKHSSGVFPKYNGLVKHSRGVFPKYNALVKHSCGVFPKYKALVKEVMYFCSPEVFWLTRLLVSSIITLEYSSLFSPTLFFHRII